MAHRPASTKSERKIAVLASLVDVKQARMRAQRQARQISYGFHVADPVLAEFARKHPQATLAQWKLAREQSMRAQRGERLRPVE